MSDGTSFQIDLPVNGAAEVNSAASALDTLAARMASAGEASLAASAAVKAGEAAYNQAETSADRAARALEKIGLAADAQRGKLAAAMDAGDGAGAEKAAAKLQNLVARQDEAAAKASTATAAMNEEAAALDALKSAAAAASSAESALVKEEEAAAKAATSATEGIGSAGESADGAAFNFRALGSGLGKLGGPLGQIGQTAAGVGGAMQKLGKSIGAAGPYVAAAVVAVALAASFVVATFALAKFAVTSADAARTSALLSAGIAGSVAGGVVLDKTLDDLGNKVPQTREELSSMASDLAKTGLKGAALSTALETAAVKAAKLKWGPDFAKQMLSLDSQSARLKSSITGIFSGLKIEGLLEGFSKVVGLFDKNSASAKGLKVVFESMFQPIVDGATSMLPKVVSTFLKLEILFLKAAITVKPYSKQILEAASALGTLAGFMAGSMAVGITTFVALAGALVVSMMFIRDVTVDVARAVVGFATSLATGASSAISGFTGKIDEGIAYLQGLSLADVGQAMIDGLVAGITGAGPKVLGSITGVVGGAVDGAKALLGIHSPSKVFEEIGTNTGEGMAQGVDGSSSGVQGSLESMVAPPDAPAPGGAKGGGGGGHTFQITIQASGGDAPSIAAAVKEVILDILEGGRTQLGASVPA